MVEAPLPPKRDAFLALLKQDWAQLHVDPRRKGVILPASVRGMPHVALVYGYDLPVPITDLVVDDEGVRATLSFSRLPHLTFVPWGAVFGISFGDGRGLLYADDVPADVLPTLRADGDDTTAPTEGPARPPRRARRLPGAAAARAREPSAADHGPAARPQPDVDAVGAGTNAASTPVEPPRALRVLTAHESPSADDLPSPPVKVSAGRPALRLVK